MSKTRLKAVIIVVAEILWRSFGLALKFLPVGLGLGGVLAAATADVAMVFWGALGAWLPALFEAYGEIGEEIATTAKVTKAGINRGFAKAVKIIEKQEKELAEKKKN